MTTVFSSGRDIHLSQQNQKSGRAADLYMSQTVYEVSKKTLYRSRPFFGYFSFPPQLSYSEMIMQFWKAFNCHIFQESESMELFRNPLWIHAFSCGHFPVESSLIPLTPPTCLFQDVSVLSQEEHSCFPLPSDLVRTISQSRKREDKRASEQPWGFLTQKAKNRYTSFSKFLHFQTC